MRFIITAAPGTSETAAPGNSDANAEAEGAPGEGALRRLHEVTNEELMKAGVLIASEGLNPGGARARRHSPGASASCSMGPSSRRRSWSAAST